jgi:SAM-dependent methyltransferase
MGKFKTYLKRFAFYRKLGMLRRIIRRIPWIFKGFIFARHYSEKNPGSILPAPGPASPEARGALFDYFDSHTQGPGIWKWAHYFNIYERYLAKFVGTEVTIVEVGVYSGGSLGMWSRYFGPRSRIVGIDIEPACRTYARENMEIFIGDQADRAFWADFRKKVPVVDILIDDGGHLPQQMRVTLEEMLPHLRPGGIFITEDIHGVHHHFESYVSGLARELNAMNYARPDPTKTVPSDFQKHIYAIHRYAYMTVIEKTAVPFDHFASTKRGTEWQPFFSLDGSAAKAG